MTTTLTPYLAVHDSRAALAFYEQAFGAREHSRMEMDDGRIGHAEFSIDGTVLYLADEWPELRVLSPNKLDGYAVSLVLHVPDVDAVFERAVAAGAKVERPLTNEEYGRIGWLIDPFGHRWSFQGSVPARG